MQIKTVTNILSWAHKSLVDFEFCLSENFMKQRRHIRGTERARRLPVRGCHFVWTQLYR